MDVESVPPLTAATFDRLSDRVRFALGCAVEILEAVCGPACGETTPLAGLGADLHESLRAAVSEAQSLWFDSGVQPYLIQPAPVHMDTMPARAVGRVSGSCHVDLVLAVTSTLVRAIDEGTNALDWLDAMRFATAVGDAIGARWSAIGAAAACECRTGAERWKTANGRSSDGGQRWSRRLSVVDCRRVMGLTAKQVTADLRRMAALGQAERATRQAWRLDLRHLDEQQLARYDSLRAEEGRAEVEPN